MDEIESVSVSQAMQSFLISILLLSQFWRALRGWRATPFSGLTGCALHPFAGQWCSESRIQILIGRRKLKNC